MGGFKGRPRRGTFYREVWGVQDRSKIKASAKKQAEREKTLGEIRGVEGIYWNKNVSARPNGLREEAETSISCRGPEPTRKKKDIYQ